VDRVGVVARGAVVARVGVGLGVAGRVAAAVGAVGVAVAVAGAVNPAGGTGAARNVARIGAWSPRAAS
jgi:hypothetical protein